MTSMGTVPTRSAERVGVRVVVVNRDSSIASDVPET